MLWCGVVQYGIMIGTIIIILVMMAAIIIKRIIITILKIFKNNNSTDDDNLNGKNNNNTDSGNQYLPESPTPRPLLSIRLQATETLKKQRKF